MWVGWAWPGSKTPLAAAGAMARVWRRDGADRGNADAVREGEWDGSVRACYLSCRAGEYTLRMGWDGDGDGDGSGT